MSEHDRDLAEAIHHEIISPASVDRALDHFHDMLMQPERWRVKDYADGWIVYDSEAEARGSQEARNGARIEPSARDRLWTLLATTSGAAIDAVLARRQRASRSGATEAARTGPWDHTAGLRERVARAIYDAPNGIDGDQIADMLYEDFRITGATADECRDQVMAVCQHAADAALAVIGQSKITAVEEPGYPGSLLPPKRGAP